MKTKFFRKNKFPLFWRGLGGGLLWLCLPFVLSAQNGITLSGLVINAGTATFNVSWDKNNVPPVWSDTVWVFVDYNKNGVMTRLPLRAGATLTAHTAPDDVGKVIEMPGNTDGVWVVGNARSAGNFSATVKLLTATATATGACVYASNYPPVGQYTSVTNISFRGTRPYDVVLQHTNGSSTVIQVAGGSFTIPSGYTLQSFTDKTGASGIIHCFPPTAPTIVNATFCVGLSGQLVASASGNVTIAWYNIPTGGTPLTIGNVLSLPILYNTSTPYYAAAISDDNCESTRTVANYTVDNCIINGYCPGFSPGIINTSATPATCNTFDSGQIGQENYFAACRSFYPGQIGLSNYAPACMSFNAGYIGN